MAIQKNKRRKPVTIKHFTLNATVLAILALQAKVGRADDLVCPNEITAADSYLVDQPCNFSSGSSLTVENGGTVGNINMDTHNASQIVIDAGGSVSNTAGTGIKILHSSLSNGLVNNGTISTGGISIAIGGQDPHGDPQSGTVDGGITNNGRITATGGTGILVQTSSTVNGGISNSGTITTGGTTFEGIAVVGNSAVNGNITNTGTISAANGVFVRLSSVNGNIVNSGTIDGLDTGVSLNDVAHINGDIINSGAITATGTDSRGISIRSSSEVSGTISNSGSISGAGIGLAIDSGTVSHGISNSGTISGGSVGIALLDTATVSDGISNSGIIRGGSTGIAVENTSTLSGGISNSGTIQGGTNAIFVNPSRSVDINILGQHARLIGNVDAAGSNFNVTSGADFTSEGTFNVNNFNIASNGIFNMANAITVQNAVNNSGTLSVGNTNQTITGNYTQNTGGTFQTEIIDGTHYGQLNVTGAADLSQSGNINIQLTPTTTIHSGETFSNIISGGTLAGPTGGFNTTSNSFIWNFIANTTDPGVNLTATVNPAAYSACQGSYCQNAANTIIGQVAAGNSAFDPYNTLSTASAFTTAASQATPELTNENTHVFQFITSSVMDSVPLWDTLHDKSTEDAASYQPGKVWFKPYRGTMMQDENNSAPGFNATTYGFVIGKDSPLSSNGWLFGAALAAGKDNLAGNAELDGQTINSDTYQGMLYGVKKFTNNVYLAGQGLVGYGNNDTSRSIPLYSTTATGSYNSWFTNMRAQLGWNYTVNRDLVLTPELDASYFFINQGSYKESGSTMDLAVNSNNNSSLVLGAYGNAAYHLTTFNNQQQLALTGYAGVAHDVLNNQPQTTATFAAGGPSFSTYGTKPNGLVFRSGAGLTYGSPIKPLSWSLHYDIQRGNNAHSGVGAITVAYKIS